MRISNSTCYKKHVMSFILVLALLAVPVGCTNTSKVNELLQGKWSLEYKVESINVYVSVYYRFDRNNKLQYYEWNSLVGEKEFWVGSYEIEDDNIYIYNANGLTREKLTYYLEKGSLYLLNEKGNYLTKE